MSLSSIRHKRKMSQTEAKSPVNNLRQSRWGDQQENARARWTTMGPNLLHTRSVKWSRPKKWDMAAFHFFIEPMLRVNNLVCEKLPERAFLKSWRQTMFSKTWDVMLNCLCWRCLSDVSDIFFATARFADSIKAGHTKRAFAGNWRRRRVRWSNRDERRRNHSEGAGRARKRCGSREGNTGIAGDTWEMTSWLTIPISLPLGKMCFFVGQ